MRSNKVYNKLFSKIVDSSIWMEPDHVRLVWMMFIAIMDEDGFVSLASVKNVAHRAVIDVEKAQHAIDVLESPDPESSNPANEGRRLTRVPGGWIVNNAGEYREIVKREHQKELNRERVRKHRSGKADCNAHVTTCNGHVITTNETVTPSEADTEADTEAKAKKKENTKKKPILVGKPDDVQDTHWEDWLEVRKAKRAGPVTKTVLDFIRGEAAKVRITLDEAVAIAAGSGWITFNATYSHGLELRPRLPTPEERARWTST